MGDRLVEPRELGQAVAATRPERAALTTDVDSRSLVSGRDGRSLAGPHQRHRPVERRGAIPAVLLIAVGGLIRMIGYRRASITRQALSPRDLPQQPD
jgi:hypothetical protein